MQKNKTQAKTGPSDIYPAPELYEMLKKEAALKPSIAFRSGLPSLDRYITEFRAGEVTVISGRTGHGKTTFARTLTRAIVEQGHTVLWFSFEEPTLNFLEKTIDKHGNIPCFFLPLTLVPNKLEYIENKIKEFIQTRSPLSAIFIDHMHYLCDLQEIHLTIEIGRVMRWLAAKAKQYNVAIFLIAHMQKMLKYKLSEIDNDALKDSSSIAQDADNVMFVVRSDKEDNIAKLKITKNRRNGWRNKYIDLIKVGNYLEEVADGLLSAEED